MTSSGGDGEWCMNKELMKTDHCIISEKIADSFSNCIAKKYTWQVTWDVNFMAEKVYKNVYDDVRNLLRDEMANNI